MHEKIRLMQEAAERVGEELLGRPVSAMGVSLMSVSHPLGAPVAEDAEPSSEAIEIIAELDDQEIMLGVSTAASAPAADCADSGEIGGLEDGSSARL